MSDQPLDSTVAVQVGSLPSWVCFWSKRCVPEKYTLTARYGDAVHARTCAVDGALAASKPRPLRCTTPGDTVVPVAACAGVAATRPATTISPASAAAAPRIRMASTVPAERRLRANHT